MCIDVIGAILRVILEDEDGRVSPIGAAGNGFHHASHSEIIVRDGGVRRGRSRTGPGRVVVRQAQEHKAWQLLSHASFAGMNENSKLTQKLVGAELVGIAYIEVRKVGIEVAAQLRLVRGVVGDQRNLVLVRALPSAQLLRSEER